MEYYNPEPTLSQEVDPSPFDACIQRLDIDSNHGVHHHVNQCQRVLGTNFPVVLVAQGKEIPKAVSCAELIKAKKTDCEIHQINFACFIRTVETYEPVLSGLESIRVTRTTPALQILLSLEPQDDKSMGYQKTEGLGKRYGKQVLPMGLLNS